MKTSESQMRWSKFLVVLGLIVAGCGGLSEQESGGGASDDRRAASPPVAEISFDFIDGRQQWKADVAGYTEEHEGRLDFNEFVGPLPAEAGRNGNAYSLSGRVFSPELLFYLVRKLGPEEGLEANRIYSWTVGLRWATDRSIECPGAGGSPGEADLLVVARSNEPKKVRDEEGVFRLDVPHGYFSFIGHAGYDGPCDERFRMKEKSTRVARFLETNKRGEAWVVIGFSPVALAPHSIHFDQIRILIDGSFQNPVTTP
jgi:hypothetical protein